MAYGIVSPSVVPVATVGALPVAGASDNLFIAAASMLALGVVVYLVTLVLARKSAQATDL